MRFLIKLSVVLLSIGAAPTAVSAASVVKVKWNISAVSGGSSVSLRDIAAVNSKGKKSWKKTGDCILTATKLKMGTGPSCVLSLTVAKSGKFPSKTFKKKITNPDAYSGPKLRIGDIGPGGGVVFYVGSFSSAGSVCNKSCMYLEAAPIQPDLPWCDVSTNISTSGISSAETSVGSGMSNTIAIASICATGAAKSVLNQTFGTKSDWFLPSVRELGALAAASRTLASHRAVMPWSSTQDYLDGRNAMQTYLGEGGTTYGVGKDLPSPVIPIRAF
jgi:hypothetical protein